MLRIARVCQYDEGLAALVAPPPADAPPPQAEALAQLRLLNLGGTQITDDGCAHLASRLNALPALTFLCLGGISASDAAIGAVLRRLAGWEVLDGPDVH